MKDTFILQKMVSRYFIVSSVSIFIIFFLNFRIIHIMIMIINSSYILIEFNRKKIVCWEQTLQQDNASPSRVAIAK